MDTKKYIPFEERLDIIESNLMGLPLIRWTADYLERLCERIEKLEAALKEEQAKTAELDKILSGMVQAMATSSVHSPDFSTATTNAQAQEQVGKDMARATHGPGFFIDDNGIRRRMGSYPNTMFSVFKPQEP